MPPAWALPCSGSLANRLDGTLTRCMSNVASMKPSRYDQSCIWLRIANRFALAASMSLRCAEVNVAAGLQRCANH